MMVQESVRLQIPFESLLDSVAELSLKDKLRLWEFLDEQIAQAEEEAWEQDPTVQAEILEARAAYQARDYVAIGEIYQLTLDPSGHILISPAIRARLRLAPGMTFVVEERDNNELMLRLQDEEPPVVDKDGVLVVQSQVVGDIANAVWQERDARATELVQRAEL
jgi:hypothetical protein